MTFAHSWKRWGGVLAVLLASSGSAWSACPDGKTYPVTLTFDDGPVAFTRKALEVLKRRGVKGTFFVLGERVNASTVPILQEMKNDGHTIAYHTYAHIPHGQVAPERARENINRIPSELRPFLSPLLRLPYGDGFFKTGNPAKDSRGQQVMAEISRAGFRHVAWDIDTNDWDPKRQPFVKQTILKQICSQKGGIVLMHDIHRNTVDNLDDWIGAILAEGHQIVGPEHFLPEAKKLHQDPKAVNSSVASEVAESCRVRPFLPGGQIDELARLIQKICDDEAKGVKGTRR